MARGTFIVVEGGEGSGKSSIIERLKKEFPNAVYTQDPGGTDVGEKIRSYVLGGASAGIDPRTELLIFLAARSETISKVIKPALEGGKNVVSNRFSLSSIAYQIYGRERPDLFDLFRDVTNHISEGCIPDMTIYLDVTPEKGLERARSRAEESNRFDKETLEFHARVREGFKKHLSEFGEPIIIDSDRSLDEVWTEVLTSVQSVL